MTQEEGYACLGIMRQGLQRTLRLCFSYVFVLLYNSTAIYTIQKGSLAYSESLTLEMFNAHSNSNYTVDDLKMGHPTQLIKTLLCNLPLEETRTACTNISTRSTSLREDGIHLQYYQVLKAHRKAKEKL